MNFAWLIHQVSKRLPDKTALIENGESVSYARMWQKIKDLSSYFLELGLKKGDKVAIILPNCKEFIFSFFAILRAQLVAIPIDPQFTAHEIKEIFTNAEPKAIISNQKILNKINVANKSLVSGKVIINSDEDLKKDIKIKYTLENTPVTKNSDIASINYTYRGYGYPLGAVFTHGNYTHGAVGYLRLVQPELDQRFLVVMPISHIFALVGCVVVPFLRGATVILMKSIVPSHIFKAIHEHKIDFIVGVPTLYRVLLENYDKNIHDISTLKDGISGGAYMDHYLYAEIKKRMKFQVRQGYGLTEALPVMCNPKFRIRPGSIGIPGHEVKVKIVDKNNKEKDTGESGEILIGGPTVSKQYYKRQRETDEVFKNGWVHTGDIGSIDKDGYLYFKGLQKDIVKIGGNTVDITEVKNVLGIHPDIKDVKIEIKKHKLWGNNIEAQVSMKKGTYLTERDLRKYCSDKIATYKIPRNIVIYKEEKI